MSGNDHVRIQKLSLLALALLLCPGGCGRSWQATIVIPDGSEFHIDGKVLANLADFAEGEQGIPLERVLWMAGHRIVERLAVIGPNGGRHDFEWAAVAGEAWWLEDGRIAIDGKLLPVSRLEVEPPALAGRTQASITDLAPTVAQALGIPIPAQATGQVMDIPAADQVLLLFLDGFGYLRFADARDEGLIPNLAALGEPFVGLTAYPPSTSVATAALLTGAPPEVTGVDRRGIRGTEVETLFDGASAAGLRVVAVEGEALAFNLRSAEMQLSGDRDGDGSTDDNVRANALAVLDEGMPDLFYVHFHGIDDAGHTYGPGTLEEERAIRRVDAAVGQLIAATSADTLIIAFADHGMHRVEEEGRLGNHGHLIEQDMFIPIFVAAK